MSINDLIQWTPQAILERGLYAGVPDPIYRSHEAVSCSGLKHYGKTAAHGRAAELGQVQIARPETLVLGRLCHTAVLEPHLLDVDFVVAPRIDRRTKAGKAEWAAFQEGVGSATVVSEDQHQLALAIRDSVRAHPLAAKFLEHGSAEVTQLWDFDGVPAKSRLDWLTELDGEPLIFDLKTTQDASTKDFPKSCARFKYHTQAAMYSDGFRTLTGERPRFVFGAVEKEPPFGVQLFEYDLAAIERGREDYLSALHTYVEAHREGKWRGYSEGIVQMELPAWA